LDEEAEDFIRKLNGYSKEMKKWEIVNFIRSNIDQFRQTLPLVKMLKERYMRDRHWDKLK
jgi:sulfur relay (sulfurtransferase) DsrC/TusE family protein